MVKRFIIDVDTDGDHDLEDAGYVATVTRAQVSSEALGDLMSVLDGSTREVYEENIAEQFTIIYVYMGFVSLLFFIAGLSMGIVMFLKSSSRSQMEDYLRRCCPWGFRGRVSDPVSDSVPDPVSGSVPDPILMSVYDHQGEESVKDGEGSSGSADDEESKTSDAVKSNERDEASASGREGENAEAKDDRKTKGEKEGDGKSSSSSSSSSEGEDEEGSVRHRKKVAADGTDEGEGAPVTEDKGEDEQPK
ncbi:serrate RNA effector molecule homolog [Eriocheir sinensis]|uniref:serrate RNA effector molecule homolog n=1 Tax=Eriocheir sinensis TaxID=95602 RepID=UPI0021C6D1A7|nr:serrate RNA effector molecule homolog [Eriocheir sinensis]